MDVNEGSSGSPFEYDQVNIICPLYDQRSTPNEEDTEKFIIYHVNKVSISTSFYEQIFHTKVFWATILYLQFGFVIFLWKNIGAKAARKMLVKITTGGVRHLQDLLATPTHHRQVRQAV